MNATSDQRNPVEILAEEFLNRKRRGEKPTFQEYIDRHPELAGEIRELFPAILMVEDLGDSEVNAAGLPGDENEVIAGPRLRRLGDYRVLSEIGRGGMGVVYEAVQESLGRRVALKVLSASALVDEKQVRRFEREAKAAARLHHTNIVPVFGVGHHDGHHYYVMQLIAGQGLDLVLEDLRRLKQAPANERPPSRPKEPSGPPPARTPFAVTATDVAHSLVAGEMVRDGTTHDTDTANGPAHARAAVSVHQLNVKRDLDPSPSAIVGSSRLSSQSSTDRRYHQSVAHIGVQVALALEYANRQGVLHRDIKPSNLLLDARGNIWVADFGLAKTTDADDLTHSGDILGTIRYMAPERFQGQCDARSDVYSLGLTLYEMVALRPAFDAPDRHTLIERVMHEDPLPLKRLAPSVPRDLETIIAKAIARDPGLRYATANELAVDLQSFETDRPIRARRVSSAERLWRWCRRNKLVAAAAGTTALALLAATAFSLLYALEQTRHANDQSRANNDITQLANGLKAEGEELKTERTNLKQALGQSNRRLAMLNLERGRASCEQSAIGPGLLWFIASLRAATEAGDPAWQHAARANLAAWRYRQPHLKAVFSHFGAVQAVGISPDGKTICTSTREFDWLWNAESGLPIGQPFLRLPRFEGGRLVDGPGLSYAQVDTLVRPRVGHGWPFTPDGKTVVTPELDHGLVHLREAATGRVIGWPLSRDRKEFVIRTAAYSPDGQMIVTGHFGGTLQRWEAATGNPIGKALVHEGMVDRIAFSTDGKIFLSASTAGRIGTARLWNAATGQPIGKPQPQEFIVGFAFNPDGRSLLTTGLRNVGLWKIGTVEPIATVDQNLFGYPIAYDPGGTRALLRGPGFQWRMWDVSLGQPIGKPLEHEQVGGLFSTAFRPDGHRVLTVDRVKHTARLWNADTGESIGEPMELTADLIAVGFRPDGKAFFTGCADNSFRLWDGTTAKPIGKTLYYQARVTALAFHPDGKSFLVGCADNTARLCDAETGEPFGPLYRHQGLIHDLAFSPDGKTIVTGSADNTARLWNAAENRIGPPLRNELALTMASVFSPDGKLILTMGTDNCARLLDVATGKEVHRLLPHQALVVEVAISPDGKTLITGSKDKTAQLWNAATGEPVGKPLLHDAPVGHVSFSPDSKTALTVTETGTARMWKVATGESIGKPLVRQALQGLIFSPDGKSILTYVSEESVQTRAVTSQPLGKALPTVGSTTPVETRTWSWQWIEARLVDTATGQPIGKALPNVAPHATTTFSPDGKTIVTTNGPRAYRWDAKTGEPIGKPLPNQGIVETVAFSPDGQIVLTGERFSPGGKTFVTGEHFGAAHFWEVATGKPAGRPLTDKSGFSGAVFSPDGKIIVTRSSDFSRARVWDAVTREPIGKPLDHQGLHWAVAFSPDGKTILTGCADNCARLWDAATGQAIGPPLQHPGEVTSVAFSRGGEAILTANKALFRLWRIAELPDDLPRLAAWAETMTGLELDNEGGVQVLDTPTWIERRKKLIDLGGAPVSN